MKQCNTCGETKPLDRYEKEKTGYRNKCRDCRKIQRGKRVSRYYSEYEQEYRRMKKYGLTREEYESMYTSQRGACKICGTVPDKTLHIDHCHESNVVRGLLCGQCNVGLGMFKDDITLLLEAINYLKENDYV